SSLNLAIYLLFTLYSWWRVAKTEPLMGGRSWLTSGVMAGILVAMYCLMLVCISGESLSILGPAAVNVLLFGLSLLLIHDGLLLTIRRRFWGGMIVLVISLISRMFEFNTDLTLKAVVLSLCGLGIIAAGLWFEYRIKQPTRPALPENN
ncbi:MAG: hypothetical protein AAGB01_01480, partial [Cyanobacteria bacterium P01_F01_bin.42]